MGVNPSKVPRYFFKLFAKSGIYRGVRLASNHLVLLILGFFLGPWPGQITHAAHTKANLVLAAEQAKPGETVWAGVHLRMDPKWHTYWRNSGASGLPTNIDWDLPEGVTPGDLQWPVPEKHTDSEFITYIYKDEVVLLLPLKLSPSLKPGKLELKAKVSWLECEIQCVPGDADVRATLEIGAEHKPSKSADLIARWQKNLPKDGASLGARARWQGQPQGDTRQAVIEWNPSSPGNADAPDFFPYSSEEFEVVKTAKSPSPPAGKLALQVEVKKLAGDWPRQLAGLIVERSGPEKVGYEVNCPVIGAGPAGKLRVSSLVQMLLYALLGGLILNIMPCVLPVIALKILGFAGQAADDPRRVRKLGLIYALGVLVSFLALAGLVIGLKAAGHKAGWGIQFGNPIFVVFITVLVTLVALSLFGVFEINLSGKVMGAAGNLSTKQGASGAFFNGLLATILATPCTAPFLAPALGFAFSQTAAVILLIFLMVGVGLALPYVILSWHPGWLKFLPKSGPWMEKFKIAMGFPMLATAFWLFSLTPIHYGARAWWLGMFLVIVALAAWIYGEFIQRGSRRRGLAIVILIALLVGGYTGVLEAKLKWRERETAADSGQKIQHAPKGIAWERWSRPAVAKARAEGRPVVVDFTAQWCQTCNTIVKPAFESGEVNKKLLEINAAALLADYTLLPDDITDELNQFGRAGVPMVLVYPKNANEPPLVYDVVTSGVLLDALAKASK